MPGFPDIEDAITQMQAGKPALAIKRLRELQRLVTVEERNATHFRQVGRDLTRELDEERAERIKLYNELNAAKAALTAAKADLTTAKTAVTTARSDMESMMARYAPSSPGS